MTSISAATGSAASGGGSSFSALLINYKPEATPTRHASFTKGKNDCPILAATDDCPVKRSGRRKTRLDVPGTRRLPQR